MSKHEMLPFKMIVERGRLIPAEPYDAERLDTWRNGTKVNVTFVRDGGRVMERKWWAILNRAVKECKTPWKTAAEASEAIKLAIGVVNLTKTVGGEYLAYPKSLTDLDDPELDEAVQQMIDVVHHVTGVDPDEWRKQVSHIRDDNPSSAVSSDDAGGADTAEGGAGDAGAPTDTAAVEVGASTAADAGETEQTEADHGDAAGSVSPDDFKRMLMEECVDNMLRDAFSDPADQRIEKINRLEAIFNQRENLGEYPDFVRLCAETVRRVAGKESEKARAREYLMGRI